LSNPVGYQGRGTIVQVSADGQTFSEATQLTKFAPGGSKQKLVDNTNFNTPPGFVSRLATIVDSGEISCEGIYSGDASYQTLQQMHGNRTLGYFIVTLTDLSVYFFQGYVSEFMPYTAAVGKMLRYSWKLAIVGGVTAPGSAFQPNAFQPGGFQINQF